MTYVPDPGAIRCVMALIRGGVFSLYPCPRCLVHKDKLGDLSKTSKLRTAKEMQQAITRAQGQRLRAEKEEILKACGMRDVDVRHLISCINFWINGFEERVLEDRELRSACRAFVRPSPHLPRRNFSPPLGSRPITLGRLG